MTLPILFLAAAVSWSGFTEPGRVGGRKMSEGYLRGKVVLVANWNAKNPECQELLPKLESIWRSFKSKPLVIVGSVRGDVDAAKAFVEERSLSFPNYQLAQPEGLNAKYATLGMMYVVSPAGNVTWAGKDERRATEVVLQAVADIQAPRTPAAWRKLIDAEIELTPASACLRIQEFKRTNANEARRYEQQLKELKARKGMKELLSLVEFARAAKDFDPASRKTKAKVTREKIEEALEEYAPLKDLEDPAMAQEAKNSLADLKWALADFKGRDR